jgi:hypothetical protein
MNIELPPVLFYGVGVILIVFGALRAYQLGWQRRFDEGPGERPENQAGPEAAPEAGPAPRRSRAARRHITFGLLWVVMGLFLVVSTYVKMRR